MVKLPLKSAFGSKIACVLNPSKVSQNNYLPQSAEYLLGKSEIENNMAPSKEDMPRARLAKLLLEARLKYLEGIKQLKSSLTRYQVCFTPKIELPAIFSSLNPRSDLTISFLSMVS